MAIKVKIWDMNGKTGNWISAVAPAKQQAPQAQTQAPTRPTPPQNAHNQAKSNAYQAQDDDDDIPF